MIRVLLDESGNELATATAITKTVTDGRLEPMPEPNAQVTRAAF